MHCSTSQTPAELWDRLKPGGSEFPRLEVAVLGWCHSGHHWSRCSQPAIPEKKKKNPAQKSLLWHFLVVFEEANQPSAELGFI